jgi:hypothetical protein
VCVLDGEGEMQKCLAKPCLLDTVPQIEGT